MHVLNEMLKAFIQCYKTCNCYYYAVYIYKHAFALKKTTCRLCQRRTHCMYMKTYNCHFLSHSGSSYVSVLMNASTENTCLIPVQNSIRTLTVGFP